VIGARRAKQIYLFLELTLPADELESTKITEKMLDLKQSIYIRQNYCRFKRKSE